MDTIGHSTPLHIIMSHFLPIMVLQVDYVIMTQMSAPVQFPLYYSAQYILDWIFIPMSISANNRAMY